MKTEGASGGSLDHEVRTLAAERGLAADRLLEILARARDLGAKHGDGLESQVWSLLKNALDAASLGDILLAFEREDLASLLARVGYPHHLASHETPLCTISELAALITKFRAFLRKNRDAIVATGWSAKPFNASPWLDRRLSALYYTSLPVSSRVLESDLRSVALFNLWESRAATGRRRHDPTTGQLELDREDADHIKSGRAGLFELKLRALSELSRGLRGGDPEAVWESCRHMLTTAMTREEARFYLRQDRFYRGVDIRPAAGAASGPPVEIAAFLPGGLSDICELYGHCELELRYRPLHEAKSQLLSLAEEHGLGDWRDLLAGSYIELFSKPWRHELDEILDDYVGRGIVVGVTGFWSEFGARVNTALDAVSPAGDVTRSGAGVGEAASFAPAAAANEGGSELPSSAGGSPTGASADAEGHGQLNVFRCDGDEWTIRYEGGKPFHPQDVLGLRYIEFLLRHPNQEIHVIELVRQVDPSEEDGIRPARKMSENRARSEGLSLGNPGGGEVLDDTAIKDLKKAVRRLKTKIAEASESGATARVSALQRELASVEKHLSAGQRRGGGPRTVPGPAEKARLRIATRYGLALKVIRDKDVALHGHLRRFVHIGQTCWYKPIPLPHWK